MIIDHIFFSNLNNQASCRDVVTTSRSLDGLGANTEIQKDNNITEGEQYYTYLGANENRGNADLYAQVIFGPAGERSVVCERNSCCPVSSACCKTLVHD